MLKAGNEGGIFAAEVSKKTGKLEMRIRPNQPNAANSAMVLERHAGDQGRGVAGPERWKGRA